MTFLDNYKLIAISGYVWRIFIEGIEFGMATIVSVVLK